VAVDAVVAQSPCRSLPVPYRAFIWPNRGRRMMIARANWGAPEENHVQNQPQIALETDPLACEVPAFLATWCWWTPATVTIPSCAFRASPELGITMWPAIQPQDLVWKRARVRAGHRERPTVTRPGKRSLQGDLALGLVTRAWWGAAAIQWAWRAAMMAGPRGLRVCVLRWHRAMNGRYTDQEWLLIEWPDAIRIQPSNLALDLA